MMSYLEYSQQEYVIHVIYGHAAQTYHAISVFQDQTRLDHETFWTHSEHHVYACTIFLTRTTSKFRKKKRSKVLT